MRLGSAYWRFWTASGLSNLADGVLWVVLPLAALSITRSPALIAGITLVSRLPWLVFVLFAGAIADRVDRRLMLIGVSLARGLILGSLAVVLAAGRLELWMLYLAALVLGVGETLYDTSAQSVMPMIVERSQLPRANSRLYGVEFVCNTFAGPPLGGWLAGLSLVLAFTTGAGAFAAAAFAVLTMAGAFRPGAPPDLADARRSMLSDIREGLAYLRHHALLFRLALLVGGFSLGGTIQSAVFPVFAVAPGPMGLTEAGYGLLLAAMGVGAVLGSLTAERFVARVGRARSLRLAVWSGVVTVLAMITANAWLVAALAAADGFMIVVWNVITVSYRQHVVPENLLGRVNAGYRLFAWGSAPIGAALGGLTAQLFGLRTAFALSAAVLALLWFGVRTITDADLDPTPAVR